MTGLTVHAGPKKFYLDRSSRSEKFGTDLRPRTQRPHAQPTSALWSRAPPARAQCPVPTGLTSPGQAGLKNQRAIFICWHGPAGSDRPDRSRSGQTGMTVPGQAGQENQRAIFARWPGSVFSDSPD
ncbi:hypothetical protein TIFTF001_007758 [Ficus carica]|uniref:Uncharacterized protein n=1 Tax=Ficus carica TaxID=3494 RepID=A0AA87ZTR1_FICCA|nr:hypothetical protein TIFTF001_007758 [Ficus carica]